MTKVQAIAAIDARLRHTNSSVYMLRVIHGYHGGMVLYDDNQGALSKTHESKTD